MSTAQDVPRALDLPPGTYYSVTWGLEVQHGGMTNAMLQRSRALVRAGVPVTIVTYDYEPRLDEIRQALHEKGSLIDGISVVNLWEGLASWDDDQLRTVLDCGGRRTDDFAPMPVGAGDPPAYQEILDERGEFTQREFRRPDGTLLVSHRRFFRDGQGVDVAICDRQGEYLGSFTGIRTMYRWWLDSLPRDPIAYFVIDSKTAANHYPEYRREDARTIYMVHGSHLADGETNALGRLSGGRRHSFDHFDDYDGVVVLTEAQRRDVEALKGPRDHLFAVPNSREVRPPTEDPKVLDRRDARHGVALGALVEGKRFSHGIRAIASAKRRVRKLSLDIYGHGPQQKKLKGSIRKWEVRDQVRLAGYTHDPLGTMAQASFLLMTSNREGFGLVLVEAMSQGCIPIAYDIKYGPSDIITHGVDGFLVSPGDVEGVADAIVTIAKMRRKDRRAMRAAAVRRARDFSDEAVMQRWADVFREVTPAR